MKNLFLLSTAGILVAAAVTGCTCCGGNETITPCSSPAVAGPGLVYGPGYSGARVHHKHHAKRHANKHHKHHAKHHPKHPKHDCPDEAHKADGEAPMSGKAAPYSATH